MRKPLPLVLSSIVAIALAVLLGCGVAPDQGWDEPTRQAPPRTTTLQVHAIDVGKGDCILIKAGDVAALIDTGYEGTADDVLAYLRAHGVDRLAGLVITHYDRDHVGGLRPLGEALAIDEVYLPGYEGGDKNYATVTKAVSDLSLPARQVTEELSIELGDAVLTIHPSSLAYDPKAEGNEGNDNDLSLVVSLIHGEDSYLFTGDLEKEGIAAYLKGTYGQFDVLKVPHHGQRNGNTDDLLEDVRPQIAIITDGKDDPADKKTLNLLKDVGADTYRTSADGTIAIESDGAGNYEVTTHAR